MFSLVPMCVHPIHLDHSQQVRHLLILGPQMFSEEHKSYETGLKVGGNLLHTLSPSWRTKILTS